jgi:GAF domain-containing protein
VEGSEKSTHQVDEDRFRRLIDVSSSLLSELDLEEVLKSVAEAARELTGARYAARSRRPSRRRDLRRGDGGPGLAAARAGLATLEGAPARAARGRGGAGRAAALPRPLGRRPRRAGPRSRRVEFDQEDLRLLQSFAASAATAVATAQTVESAEKERAEECSARGGIEVETEIELAADPGGDEERLVYRLVQEALNNVTKHADATHAEVSACESGGKVQIAVLDDGGGTEISATVPLPER